MAAIRLGYGSLFFDKHYDISGNNHDTIATYKFLVAAIFF